MSTPEETDHKLEDLCEAQRITRRANQPPLGEPAPEGSLPVTEPEKCEVCGGDEPCSHDFDKIGWPTPSAPSLQSVAEGAAQKVSDLTDEMAADGTAWFVSKEYKEQIAAIITRHFAPLLTAREAETRDWIKWHGELQEQLQDAQAQIAERDERIGRLEKALEVERGWVAALTEDNAVLIEAADKTKAGALCVSQAGVIEKLNDDLTALRTRCEELQRDKDAMMDELAAIGVEACPIRDPLKVVGGDVKAADAQFDKIRLMVVEAFRKHGKSFFQHEYDKEKARAARKEGQQAHEKGEGT